MKWLWRNAIPLSLLGGVILFTQRGEEVTDRLRLMNYQPPDAIAYLAEATTMTETGKRLFFVNFPQISSRANFPTGCKKSENTIVLGCYISSRGIFLQNISDNRLKGVMEVTAAHEMLHVVYHRLSAGEKATINRELQEVFKGISNERVKKTIEAYRERDPNVVNNELHSILATEIRQLTPTLERHYAQYFKDRQAIVAFSERYEGKFSALEDRAKEIKERLERMKIDIERKKAELEQSSQELNTARSRLESIRGTSSPDDFNRGVDRFNAQLNNHRSRASQLQSEIEEYNKLVSQFNATATDRRSLIESLENPTQ